MFTKRSMPDGTPICDRCGNPTLSHTMSWFNTDNICPECQDKEESHPKFKEAKAAVLEHEKAGDMNWPGIGLPDDLKVKKF